jgi:hypothetical protein
LKEVISLDFMKDIIEDINLKINASEFVEVAEEHIEDTKEKARVLSEKFLWGTKIGMRHSFFMIEEYIQNKDLELSITKSTSILLGKRGNDFFIAHID